MKWALPLLSFVAIGLAFFTKRSQTTPEQDFWKWFQGNEVALFDFEKDQERTFDRLLTELHKVHPDLTFEFGPKQDGCREFVISADGIKAAFPKVETLYAAAPVLPRWKFIKFRPRRTPFDVNYGGVSVKASTVRVELRPAGPKADLTVFVPAYTPSQGRTYHAIVFLLLDQALGEYDVEMFAGNINVTDISEAPVGADSLETLPKAFDNSLPKH